MNLSNYFLKAPELKLSLNEFPFTPFCISELFSEELKTDFPSKLMLGKQAETIFENWLKHSKRFQLLAANIQIQGATQTLGELDYIISDTNNSNILHIELACKFYLLDENLGNTVLEQWIGPNRKDRLVDKLEKLKTKQFPLLYSDETTSVLTDVQLDGISIQQQYCLKAFLFVPKTFIQHKLPKQYENCLAGYYIHFTELVAESDEKTLYALPQKKEWLLPPEYLTNWVKFSEAKDQIENSIAEKRSLLVYKKIHGTIEKCFVVWWDTSFQTSV